MPFDSTNKTPVFFDTNIWSRAAAGNQDAMALILENSFELFLPRVLLSELSGKSSDIKKGVQALQDDLDNIPLYQTRNINRAEQRLAMAKSHAARYMEILRDGQTNFSALSLPATLLDAQTGKPTENGQAFLKVVCKKITFYQLQAAYRDIQHKLSGLDKSEKGNHYKKTVREAEKSFLTSLKTSGFDTYTLEKLLNNEHPRGLEGTVEDAKKHIVTAVAQHFLSHWPTILDTNGPVGRRPDVKPDLDHNDLLMLIIAIHYQVPFVSYNLQLERECLYHPMLHALTLNAANIKLLDETQALDVEKLKKDITDSGKSHALHALQEAHIKNIETHTSTNFSTPQTTPKKVFTESNSAHTPGTDVRKCSEQTFRNAASALVKTRLFAACTNEEDHDEVETLIPVIEAPAVPASDALPKQGDSGLNPRDEDIVDKTLMDSILTMSGIMDEKQPKGIENVAKTVATNPTLNPSAPAFVPETPPISSTPAVSLESILDMAGVNEKNTPQTSNTPNPAAIAHTREKIKHATEKVSQLTTHLQGLYKQLTLRAISKQEKATFQQVHVIAQLRSLTPQEIIFYQAIGKRALTIENIRNQIVVCKPQLMRAKQSLNALQENLRQQQVSCHHTQALFLHTPAYHPQSAASGLMTPASGPGMGSASGSSVGGSLEAIPALLLGMPK